MDNNAPKGFTKDEESESNIYDQLRNNIPELITLLDQITDSEKTDLDTVRFAFSLAILQKIPISEEKALPELPENTEALLKYAQEKSDLIPDSLQEGIDNSDTDGYSLIWPIAYKLLRKLPKKDLSSSIEWVVAQFHTDPYDFEKQLPGVLFSLEDIGGEEEVMKIVLDYVYEKRNQYEYSSTTTKSPPDLSYPNTLISIINKRVFNTLKKERDIEKVKVILGMIIDTSYHYGLGSYGEIVDFIRSMIDANPKDSELITLGQVLLGQENNPQGSAIHTNTNTIYEAIDFDEYEPNKEAQSDDIRIITELFERNGISHKSKITDVACGTGRLSNLLTEKGYHSITGIDISDTNLAKAKELDKTSTAQYHNADWKELPLDDKSQDVIYCLGRSLSHARGQREFDEILNHMLEKIKDDGIVLIDFANPNKGYYLEHRKQMISLLQKLNIPVELNDGSKIDNWIIDSPDGINFYDRWVPDIQEQFEHENPNYSIELVEETDIYNGNARNQYFLIRKKPNTHK